MFIVSLPYAVFHGGYWAILAMVGIAYIACYTGKILVDCLYETNEFGETVKVSAKSKGLKMSSLLNSSPIKLCIKFALYLH